MHLATEHFFKNRSCTDAHTNTCRQDDGCPGGPAVLHRGITELCSANVHTESAFPLALSHLSLSSFLRQKQENLREKNYIQICKKETVQKFYVGFFFFLSQSDTSSSVVRSVNSFS